LVVTDFAAFASGIRNITARRIRNSGGPEALLCILAAELVVDSAPTQLRAAEIQRAFILAAFRVDTAVSLGFAM
jgi:hypothetical protein